MPAGRPPAWRRLDLAGHVLRHIVGDLAQPLAQCAGEGRIERLSYLKDALEVALVNLGTESAALARRHYSAASAVTSTM
jgi:hypothetical protein